MDYTKNNYEEWSEGRVCESRCVSVVMFMVTHHFLLLLQTCGVKRGGGAMEHEATANKQPFLAPSAAGSGSSLKPSSADVWAQGENQTHIHSSG